LERIECTHYCMEIADGYFEELRPCSLCKFFEPDK
jgi:hypothetical protein